MRIGIVARLDVHRSIELAGEVADFLIKKDIYKNKEIYSKWFTINI